jgi:hypothetical protein
MATMKLGWKKLARDKHSSLLGWFVNYDRKMFYNSGPCSSTFAEKLILRSSLLARNPSSSCEQSMHLNPVKSLTVEKYFFPHEVSLVPQLSAL